MINKYVIRTLFALLCFVISILITIPALGETVFGPKQYVRTSGAPNTYTDTFLSAGGSGSLIIRNGNASGTDRIEGTDTITSAKVYINGTLIFGPSDFKSSVYSMERSVPLSNGANTLYAELSSSPGSYFSAEVTGVATPIALDILTVS